MSQFWEQRLTSIRDQVLLMAGLAEQNLALAMRAFTDRDDVLCVAAEAADTRIDELEIQLDEMVMTYAATHAPTARDSRMMLTVLKISSNLERIGDEATKIARRARLLNAAPALRLAVEIPTLGETARRMLHDGITAFIDGDSKLATEVIARDRSVDKIEKQLERELTESMQLDSKTVERALHLLTIARAIERIADHATNIAEESYYFYKAQDIRHRPALKGGGAGEKS